MDKGETVPSDGKAEKWTPTNVSLDWLEKGNGADVKIIAVDVAT